MRAILAAFVAISTVALAIVPADAGASRGMTRDYGRGKLCLATTLDNRRVSWKCGSDQRCCWNAFTNSGSCSSGNSC